VKSQGIHALSLFVDLLLEVEIGDAVKSEAKVFIGATVSQSGSFCP